jgi:heme-degrading monooxygenase HmoA
MIVVVSRFKVESGLEGAVSQAFRDRPRFVDHAPGFLGMEVFADAADPAVFYLVTRWTDQASFDAWHRSEDHRALNQYMPQGLKLVAGFTQLSRLERIPSGDRPLATEEFVADAVPLLACYLSSGHSVHLLVAAVDGMIRSVNRALATSLAMPEAELLGRSAWDLLTEHDARVLRDRVGRADRNRDEVFLLNFVNARQCPFTLECRCDVQSGNFVLLGEPPREQAAAFQEEWLRMNNQLAVLSRENARQNKELQQAKRELEQALAHLRDSHWHLKKLQEVLPICMECGKVKAGSKWEEIVQYLKENALFLSHGYCPDCLVKKAAEWGLPSEGLLS